MFLALLSKGKQRIARMSEEANGEDQHNGATADTLANLLQELLQQSKTQNDNLSALQKSIAGNEDGTLLTQMQKLRTSVADKQDKLIESFDSFAEKMAKNNSEALIDALKEVIKDFNTKINEQFGENFKHLNEAVGRLLEWQENYRIEIAELQRQFKLCAEGIVSSEAALSSITEKSQAMVEAANRLEQLLVAYDSYRSRLLDNMEAFASLSREAQDAFPVIQKNLKELTEGFSNAVQTSTSEIEQTVNKTSRLLEDSVQRSTAGVEETVHKTEERIKEQLEQLDIALQDQLTKSLSSLGNQLVSLSGKFVSDYTPLTTQLERLVRTASNGSDN
jgi:chromosome segregation ATPase